MTLRFWDATLATPGANLAADEALLHECEAGGPNVLRFWEPAETFVVLGFSNAAARETNLDACRRAGVPILRRCSGGGTVLQGPGCLNYTLVLRLDSDAAWETIPSTNRHIMERQRAGVSEVLGRPATVEGITDLCVDGLKFSGNAQRRLREALIFHGTFLWNFDLGQVGQFLAMPSHQPHYRRERSHADFLTNINIAPGVIKHAMQKIWGAREPLTETPKWQPLVDEKYGRDEWNLKY